MTLLPIVERELRVQSRRARLYWARLPLPALLMAAFGFMMMVNAARGSMIMLGQVLFHTAVWVMLGHSLFSGFYSTCDCISLEKREGTLGFLFLTSLRGYDVILGKLAANSIINLSVLLSVLPVLAIPLLMGGVSLGMVTAAACTLLASLLLSLSVGILCSTVARQQQTAGATALGIIVLLVALPLVGTAVLESQTNFSAEDLESLRIYSPGYACYLALQGTGSSGDLWLEALATQLTLSVLCLVLASLLVRTCWREKSPSRWRQRLSAWWTGLLYGGSEQRRQLRRAWLDASPIAWLILRPRLKRAVAWIFLFGSVGALLFFRWLAEPGGFFRGPFSETLIFLLMILFKMAVASEAGLVFAKDIRSGAMELILTTGLTVTEIFQGQQRALRRLFGLPSVGVCVFALVAGGWILLRSPASVEGWGTRLAFFLVIVPVFLMDIYALSWLGIWTAMTIRDPRNAGSQALSLIMGPPYLALTLIYVGQGLASLAHVYYAWPFWLTIAVYAALSLGTDWFFLKQAQALLAKRFRALALARSGGAGKSSAWDLIRQDAGG